MVNNKKKTYLTALFCVCRCILFPGTKICVASSTRRQANEVLSKIEDDFMKLHGWGSENLKREITFHTVGINNAVINFRNGSWVRVVTASDSGRGARANVLVCDEFRMIDKNTIDTVLKKFLTAARHPGYLDNPKYMHMLERNKEIYMSSAWYVDHWAYEKAKAYTANMLDQTKKYFICSLPYQISIKEGLLQKEAVKDEMSEEDFDEVKWLMEMESLFYGDTDGSFFRLTDIVNRRRLKTAMYSPSSIPSKTYKVPDLVPNERRILSVDVALMATKKYKNDASAIIINSAIPTNDNNYIANIVYMENHEGLNTSELALIIRRLYKIYKCTDLVLDTQSAGLGCFDLLVQDMVDPETGELYPALSCCNDDIMADRCKVDNAPKEIWSIKGTASFNNEICILLRNAFKTGRINLLIPEEPDAEDVLKKKISGYSKMTEQEKLVYKMPYIQTSLLVNELVKLEYEIKGTNIKIRERSGMRKDRYSSLAYNYWVQCQLERELLHRANVSFDIQSYASKMSKLNHKPTMY